jgi:hypothetical protein
MDNLSRLMASFALEDKQDQLMDTFYLHLRMTLASASQILLNRNLHQILLCSAYLILREEEGATRFNDIILHYELVGNLANG